jgi:hypothetical protein
MLLCSHTDVKKCAGLHCFCMVFQVLFVNCESLLLTLSLFVKLHLVKNILV